MIGLGNIDFVVSINISPYQLLNLDIIWALEREMMITGLKPKNIEIEITEQSYLGRGETALKEIQKLKKLGVSISLDDFGSGYASLSSIAYLPFDIIKIDRSLVEHIAVDQQMKFLFEGIVELTKKLNLKVVAEGVETIEQVDIIKSTKCDLIQGYYYGKPVPADEFYSKSVSND